MRSGPWAWSSYASFHPPRLLRSCVSRPWVRQAKVKAGAEEDQMDEEAGVRGYALRPQLERVWVATKVEEQEELRGLSKYLFILSDIKLLRSFR